MAANTTSWKKGQSGNPNGRPPGPKSIASRLRERQEDLDRIVDQLVEQAIAGNLQAIRLVLEHVDGKPNQKPKEVEENETLINIILTDSQGYVISDDSGI